MMHGNAALSVGIWVMQGGCVCGERSDGWLIARAFFYTCALILSSTVWLRILPFTNLYLPAMQGSVPDNSISNS